MKKVLTVLIMIFLFTGCNSNKDLISLTYKEYNAKIENNESFVLLIWKTGCTHCEDFEPKLKEIIKEYNLDVYSIDTSKLDSDEYAKLENKTFLTGTPTLAVFDEGKYKTRLVGDKKKDQVIKFLKTNNYIK